MEGRVEQKDIIQFMHENNLLHFFLRRGLNINRGGNNLTLFAEFFDRDILQWLHDNNLLRFFYSWSNGRRIARSNSSK